MATHQVTLVFARGGLARALKRGRTISLKRGEVALRLAISLPDELFQPAPIIDASVVVPEAKVVTAPVSIHVAPPPDVIEPAWEGEDGG